MQVPERLDQYIETERQQRFEREFHVGWEQYETWEEANVGERATASHTFSVLAEDIVSYNRACGETHPLYVDPEYAHEHSPTGELLQHPIFATAIAFYCIGSSGIGSWIRTPGARNPGQLIEIREPFREGEVITTTITTKQKFIQRNKHYLTMFMEFHNQDGVLKGTWDCSLILPATRAEIGRFVNA
jgi:acyl dehydratase